MGPSLVKSSSGEQTHPVTTPVAHSNSKNDNEVKDKKSTGASESSAVEVRGPEQEVPLDLGTRKSVPVKWKWEFNDIRLLVASNWNLIVDNYTLRCLILLTVLGF